MKLGLVGLPQVGKCTLFRLLTGQEAGVNGGKKDSFGLARVRDERFRHLVEIYQPRLETPAFVEFALFPDLGQEKERDAQTFRELEKVDAICHLVRTFQDERVFHILGKVDPQRDILTLNEELKLNDLLFIEKRRERLEKEHRKKIDLRKAALETDLLTRMKNHLEAGHFLSTFAWSEEEEKLVAGYPLLTRKPLIIVLNIGEEQLSGPDLVERIGQGFSHQAFQWIAVSAKIEEELFKLDAEERQAFLDELHINQPALDKLTLLCYNTLGLISFFTVGPDEVRAWTNRRGASAPQAGRVIHSDIERGFIRAEVMKYDDLIQLGCEQRVKEAGKLMQKGKDYIVEDGDVINFLFHV
jgi:GTP-binding protein YchF